MPKVHDPIPSRSFSIPIVGDDLDTLTEIVNESRRLKPEWKDTPQTVLISIIEDFLGLADAFDEFILTRVDSEQRDLLRQIAELKGLKRAVRDGTLEEGDEGIEINAPERRSAPKDTVSSLTPSAPPPTLGSASPTVR
jgi:hypothetical protein